MSYSDSLDEPEKPEHMSPEEINAQWNPGDIIEIEGPSGCEKTTIVLLRLDTTTDPDSAKLTMVVSGYLEGKFFRFENANKWWLCDESQYPQQITSTLCEIKKLS